MIYLLNNTDPQEIYIPKNTSGVNPHKSNSYWEGFEDGYESGETHQKNLLSSVTFTENGEYERENGWSAVTVDVPQTGSTARLEEKTVVISADTTNVTPSSGYDGMSAVTVDASSYAQENYDDGFDDGFTDGYASGSTDEKAKLSAVTFTTNTAVTISDGGYSAITVNVPQTGSSLNVEANKPYTANTNGTYTITASSGYDVMSSVTLNVNVRQQFGYIEIIDPDANLCYFELENVTPDLHSKIVLHNVTFSVDKGLGYNWRTFLTMCRVERGRICSDFSQVIFDGRTNVRYGITAITDTDITLEYDKVTIGDDVYNYAIRSQYEGITNYNNMVLFNFIKDPSTAGTTTSQARYAKVGEIEIYDSANTLTYDYIPTVDENGIICFYERINDFYVYSSNGNNDYLSANTVNLGKGSFSANGTYSASTYGLDGYSEVTINVPQTGGSANLGSKTGTTNGTYNASTDNLDGYSAFTINVDTASTYQSGYTSGETHQKSLLTTTAFTQNGYYQRENGWSGVTVNIDTASTYNSGYTSGYTDGQDNIICTFSAMTATTNGQYGSSAHPLSAITVEVPQTGSSATLGTGSFSANGTYNASTDNLDGYSAITINVQSSGSTDLRYFIEGTYQDWPDTFNIPAGTKYIRPYCFADYDLLDVIVPSSVTGMGEYAFYKSSIRYFKKENNCVIENIPKYAFAECHSLDADGWPVFNDVLSIDEYAFSDCNSQDFNTVSACCVTKIGIYAFNGCTGLTTVMLGGNLMSISYGAFNGCSNLRNIYMLSTTVPIGSNYAFIGIPNSGTFHYPRGSDYSSLQNLSVFSGWTFTGDL